MGLTCSVLGHRYGDREHIEERDRQGSEELIEVREIKTCERCGEELVVSESKEIIAVEEESTVEESLVIEDAEEDETEREEDPIDMVDSEPPEVDDGIILRESDDREPGEWPPLDEEDDEEESTDEIEWPGVVQGQKDEDEELQDPKPWPDVKEDEDEGFDAKGLDQDPDVAAQILEATGSESDVTVEQTDTGYVRAGEIKSPAEPDDSDVHTEFYCPRCEWSAKALTTSVRRGDICSNCRTGYIAERSI